jgi:hypothetical protein
VTVLRRPLSRDPLQDGRHPDLVYRVNSLLPGNGISVPGIFLASAGLVLAGSVVAAISALPLGPAGEGVMLLLSALLLAVAAILLSKGLRWRAARRRFAERNGTPDLGYFQLWDGRRGEAEVRREAEAIVRANRSRD